MHTTATMSVISKTPPSTAITMTNTLTELSYVYVIVALIGLFEKLTNVISSFLFCVSATIFILLLFTKYRPSA